MNNAPAQRQAPITNAGEAQRAIAGLNAIMDRLVETIERETAQARAGKLRDATQLDATKAELAHHYYAETERVKAAKGLVAQIMPQTRSVRRAPNLSPTEPPMTWKIAYG